MDEKLNLRFSRELRRQLDDAVRVSNRSLNREIVHRIEQSFRKQSEAADMLAALFLRAEQSEAAGPQMTS